MTFPGSDTKSAAYASKYKGSTIDPNVVVWHTTEGTSRPSYEGGATAPNYTAVPRFGPEGNYWRLDWFQHFPDTMSARALRNESGGVETNTLNCIQVELVGTCAPGIAAEWRRDGRQFVFWPDAPEAALEDLAEFVAWAHKAHGIRLESPGAVWTPYPESYGRDGQRFSMDRWRKFYGHCGHQHVPENDHGDPGALRFGQVLDLARDLLNPEDPEQEWRTIDVSRVQAAFLAAMDQDKPPTGDRARVHVKRLQRALNQRFPNRTPIHVSGMVDDATLKRWAAHESMADGSGRPTVPDLKSMRALVSESKRFKVRK